MTLHRNDAGFEFFSVLNDFRLERLSYSVEIVPVPIVLPNEACPDYGKKERKKERENIVLKDRYGKQNTALLRCKTCKKTFSENRGTPFFGLHTPKETVLRESEAR